MFHAAVLRGSALGKPFAPRPSPSATAAAIACRIRRFQIGPQRAGVTRPEAHAAQDRFLK